MPRIKVVIRGREKPWNRTINTRAAVVKDIIVEIGINPLDVLVKLNKKFVPDTQKARPGDTLELIEITSRG